MKAQAKKIVEAAKQLEKTSSQMELLIQDQMDCTDALYCADNAVTILKAKVQEAITVIETVKKIPDYNSYLSIEQAFSCTWMQSYKADPKLDDKYLVSDEEPQPLYKDNCMKEAIGITPAPIILGSIDLHKQSFNDLGRKSRTQKLNNKRQGNGTSSKQRKLSKTQTIVGRSNNVSRISASMMDGDDERESEFQDDDDIRSKKSYSVYSAHKSKFGGPIGGGGSKIRKLSPDRSSVKTSAAARKERKSPKQKKEVMPVQVKLDLKVKKYHKDKLDDAHFTEQRSFLYRKQRQEALAAKISSTSVRGMAGMRSKRASNNEDITNTLIDKELELTLQDSTSFKPPITTSKAGQQIQFSTKERTTCMENDRFMITKKVNLANLPDTMSPQPDIPNIKKIPTTIERSAKEVHEMYMQKIQQLKAARQAQEDAKRLAEQQENMLRNFTKKPTTVNSNDGANDFETGAFNAKRGSKTSTVKDGTIRPSSNQGFEDELDEGVSQQQVYRPATPEINEDALKSFDMRSQKITSLLADPDTSIALTHESKPVRDVLKANYGVFYKEDVQSGGAANVRIQGDSFYLSPGRNMRRSELENKQRYERESKVASYMQSRMGDDVNTSIDMTLDSQRRSKEIGASGLENNQISIAGDSLYQPSHRGSPRIEFPSISYKDEAAASKIVSNFMGGNSVKVNRPKRDQMVSKNGDPLMTTSALVSNLNNIEIIDDTQRAFSPKTGVSFFKPLNSIVADSVSGIGSTAGAHQHSRYAKANMKVRTAATSGPQSGRPVSMNQLSHRKSPRVPISRSIKLKDSILRESGEQRDSILRSSVAANFGTIMNYKKMPGLNDRIKTENFRKWTGMPQTTRNDQKVQGLSVNHAKLVAHHRKKTQMDFDLASMSIDSTMNAMMSQTVGSGGEKHRNISRTAWNKIRLASIKQERLSKFEP